MKIEFKTQHCVEYFKHIPVGGTFRIEGSPCVYLKIDTQTAWGFSEHESHKGGTKCTLYDAFKVIPVEVTIVAVDCLPDTY